MATLVLSFIVSSFSLKNTTMFSGFCFFPLICIHNIYTNTPDTDKLLSATLDKIQMAMPYEFSHKQPTLPLLLFLSVQSAIFKFLP